MNRNTWARYFRRSALATIVLALLAMAWWPSPRLVDMTTVDRGAVRETFEAEGRTRVRDRYVITAPIAGTARRLALQPGDAVKAGQVLVVLDPLDAPALDARTRSESRARIEAARDRVAAAGENARSAEMAARQAGAEDERLRRLAGDKLVAAEAAERAQSAYRQAQREAAAARFLLATSEHELQAAEAVLAHRSGERDDQDGLALTAPADGVLLRRHFESARPVQMGEALLEVGDPTALEVEVDVLSADAVRLRPGMPVELLRWGESRPLDGEVRRIEPGAFTKVSALGVEEQRVWVIVDLTSPREQWQQLGEAYRANARFLLRSVDDVLRAPASAVFRQGEGHAVFRVAGSRAERVPVVVGLEGEGLVEIREGLAAGDRVIVHPDRELEPGERVRSR